MIKFINHLVKNLKKYLLDFYALKKFKIGFCEKLRKGFYEKAIFVDKNSIFQRNLKQALNIISEPEIMSSNFDFTIHHSLLKKSLSLRSVSI
jgi:hypothetical protein